jgi:hypothetical protein
VATWLESHIESRAHGLITCSVEGEHLCMGQPDPFMGSLADHITGGVDHDRAHPRVGMSPVIGGELDCPSHVAGIAHSATRH